MKIKNDEKMNHKKMFPKNDLVQIRSSLINYNTNSKDHLNWEKGDNIKDKSIFFTENNTIVNFDFLVNPTFHHRVEELFTIESKEL